MTKVPAAGLEYEKELRRISADYKRQQEIRLYGRSIALGGALVLIGNVLQVIGPFNTPLAVIGLAALLIGGVWLLDNRAKLRRLSERHASLKATIAATLNTG